MKASAASLVSDASQGELRLRIAAELGPRHPHVLELCGLLRGRGWMTARRLREKRPGWDDRYIRALASASAGAVMSGPGCPGYRLTAEALTEAQSAANHLFSQARAMKRRGIQILRAAHEAVNAGHPTSPTH